MSFFFGDGNHYRAQWSVKRSTDDDDNDNDNDSLVFVGSSVWQFLNSSTQITPVTIFFVEHRKLVCYARLDDELDKQALAVPQALIALYPDIFHSSSVQLFVSSTKLVTLSTVVVIAVSQEAYQAASQSPILLRQLLQDGQVLRQGETIELPVPSPLVYKLSSLEPVSQGRALAGETEILLLPPTHPDASLTNDSDYDHDLIEINEGFLGSSIMLSSPEHFDGERQSATVCVGSTAYSFGARSLEAPQDLLQDYLTLYVRTSDLGKIGILSHDWAVAYVKRSQSRLVRIVANDDLVNSSSLVAGSPTLLNNIFLGDFFCDSPSLFISSSPFGASQPAIPVARTVTLARIASPFSINKRYQSAFVNALKTYFESGRKLMKQSDIFAVPIDTDDSRRRVVLQSDLEGGLLGLSQLARPYRHNEVVFFKVTNIEYDLMPQPDSFQPDFYRSSTLGELGFWVDSTVTRIIQTGSEHSRVPDVTAYMHLGQPIALGRHKYLNSSSTTSSWNTFSKLLSLTSAALSERAMDYHLSFSFLLKGERGVGKFTTISRVAQMLGFHLSEIDCYELLDESDVKTEATLRAHFDQAVHVTPCVLVLRHIEALSRTTQSQDSSLVVAIKDELAKSESSWRMTGHPLVFVGTTSEGDRLPTGILDCFKHVVEFEAPNEEERLEILQCLLAGHELASDISLQHIASQTAALILADLRDLVLRAQAACMTRIGHLELDPYLSITLNADDFKVALGEAKRSFSDSIGAPKIPAVSWEDVGGLAHVKTDILDMIQLPLEYPELFADGLKKRSGILLYGPPGTGKTLIAKAVATSFSLNFFSVKGPELLNMYIGESEANVRKVFQKARDAKPCIIFFDELDSVAPKRGNQGDSGGVMDRIVSQLLAELDGISSGKDEAAVFVIGATNRPDLLDPALLRPGRFDRMLYLGVSETHEAQCHILEALTRKFRLVPGFDLRSVAEKCPLNYTGADFYALCSDAMLSAMSQKAKAVDQKIAILNARPLHQYPHPITPQFYLSELASTEDIEVLVSAEDFDQALRSLVPSVSRAEMEHYAQVQKHFSEPKGPS